MYIKINANYDSSIGKVDFFNEVYILQQQHRLEGLCSCLIISYITNGITSKPKLLTYPAAWEIRRRYVLFLSLFVSLLKMCT